MKLTLRSWREAKLQMKHTAQVINFEWPLVNPPRSNEFVAAPWAGGPGSTAWREQPTPRMVRAAGLGSRACKGAGGISGRRELAPTGIKHCQPSQGRSGCETTARPKFLPTGSVLCFTPCLCKLFLYQFVYDFLMMTMFAFKDCTS